MLESLQMVNQQAPWFFQAAVFVFGACIGSFLNVCIYRIPAGKSIVFPGSHCACGQPIAWHDNLPILSWFLLRGRARCCGRPFSFRYPVIEALTGALFMLCWIKYPPAVALCGMVLCGLMIPASFIDIDHMIIPEYFSVGGAAAGVVLSIFVPLLHGYGGDWFMADSVRSLLTALIGAMIGSALVLWLGVWGEIIFRREAMGFGDVMLMGAIGAFCGWQGAVFALVGGAVIGIIAYLAVLLAHKIRPSAAPVEETKEGNGAAARREEVITAPAGEKKEVKEEDKGHIPFGPMLAAGAIVYFLFFRQPVDAYFAGIEHIFFGVRIPWHQL